MATESLTKIQVPEGTDSVAPLADLFTALANSARVPVPVASATEMAQVVSAASSAGFAASSVKPMFFYRTDEKRLYVHDGSSGQAITSAAGKASGGVLAGIAQLVHTGAGTEGVTINFPGGFFSVAPAITLTVGPSAASFNRAMVGDPSTSSAGLFVSASSAQTFRLHWLAVAVG